MEARFAPQPQRHRPHFYRSPSVVAPSCADRQQAHRRRRRPRRAAAAPRRDGRTRLGHAAEEPLRRRRFGGRGRSPCSCRAAASCAAATCSSPRTARWSLVKARPSRCSSSAADGSPLGPAARRVPPGQSARAARGPGRPPAARARPRAGRHAAPAWALPSRPPSLRSSPKRGAYDAASTGHAPGTVHRMSTITLAVTRAAPDEHGHAHGHEHAVSARPRSRASMKRRPSARRRRAAGPRSACCSSCAWPRPACRSAASAIPRASKRRSKRGRVGDEAQALRLAARPAASRPGAQRPARRRAWRRAPGSETTSRGRAS